MAERISGELRYEELINPDRNDIILARLYKDAISLLDMGLDPRNVKNLLGTFAYVTAFVRTPLRVFPVEKLPKDAKWKDAETISSGFSNEGSPKTKREGHTFQFLAIGDDLYIKPYLVPGLGENFPDSKAAKSKTVVIHDYKANSAIETLYGDLPEAPRYDKSLAFPAAKQFYDIPKELASGLAKINPEFEDAIRGYWQLHGLKIWPRHILRDMKDVIEEKRKAREEMEKDNAVQN